MPKVYKAVIGVKPVTKIFRVRSMGGELADAVLAARGSHGLSDDFYTNVGFSPANTAVRLNNDALGNVLLVDLENIVFTKNLYENGKQFDFDDFCSQFRAVWEVANSVLQVKNIRRIGYVAEFRFPVKNAASKHLLESLTKLNCVGHADKFTLSFESRNLTDDGKIPDWDKGDFINVIRQLYDSAIDTENATPGFLNANLDVQRYYAPAFNGRVADEVMKLHNRHFQGASKIYFEQLRKLGLLNGQEA
jgi:hypothetical protein